MIPQPESEKKPEPVPFLMPPGPRDYHRDFRHQSPVVAAVLSLLPGLGHAYLGYSRLGILHAIMAAALVGIMSPNILGMLEPMVGIFMVFFWLFAMVDAHRRALLLSESVTRMETEKLSEDLKPMTRKVRITLGITMTLAGLLGLLLLRVDIPLAWLEMWWPAGFVLLGLYLTLKAVKERAAKPDPSQN